MRCTVRLVPYSSREKKRAYAAAYNAAHREEKRAYDAAYNAAHREERRAYDAAHDAAHREKKRAYNAAHPNRHLNETIARLRRATEHFYGGNTDGNVAKS